MRVYFGGLLLLLLTAAAPSGAYVWFQSDFVPNWEVQTCVSAGDHQRASFFDTHVIFNGAATTGPDSKAGIRVTGVPKAGVQEAYVEDDRPPFTYRMGFYHTPFGYEAATDSGDLITLERSYVISDLIYRNHAYDSGLFVDRDLDKDGLSASLAITNGDSMDANDIPTAKGNADKVVTARVGHERRATSSGVSYLWGNNGDNSLLGVDYRTKVNHATVVGEAVSSFVDGATGCYMTTADTTPGNGYRPYARLEWYNPNSDQEHPFTAMTAGVSKGGDPTRRDTLEIRYVDRPSPTLGQSPVGAMPAGHLTVAYQWQRRF